EFTRFLETTIIKNPPEIMSEELKAEMDASKKEYQDKETPLEKELRIMDNLLNYLYIQYFSQNM
ncbi:MAG: hypothetical protein LBD37_06920, partial [Treponema sp.]|nr:hypothetical protein [Treponema sp.]